MCLTIKSRKLIARILRVYNRKQKLIDKVCFGYSGCSNWKYFKMILTKPWIKDVCVLGVYYGRDIAYIAAILESLGRKDYTIVGIDKFEDAACNDWPEELRGLSWHEAGFGPAPDIEKTKSNFVRLGFIDHVSLQRGLAEEFLRNTEQLFDFIYIDTSHDYQTTMATIKLAVEKLRPNGLVGGDDCSNQGTWGVESAVQDSFVRFEKHYNWFWLAQPADYKRQEEISLVGDCAL